jgi:hypothetical protein
MEFDILNQYTWGLDSDNRFVILSLTLAGL